MQRFAYRIKPEDLKGVEAGQFVALPGRLALEQGGVIYVCVDAGANKAPLKPAIRAKVGEKRFRTPQVMEKLLAAKGDGWRLEFSKLPELKQKDEEAEITVQPGFLLEAIFDDSVPLVIVFYGPDEATGYGMAGGEHGNIPCPELAADIEWHEGHLAELGDLKRACEGLGGDLPTGGGGNGLITLETDNEDNSAELCGVVDFMIATAEKDLAAAKKEYDERCNRPSV